MAYRKRLGLLLVSHFRCDVITLYMFLLAWPIYLTVIFLIVFKALRLTVFGACDTPPRGEWLRTGFVFRDPEKELSYGLRARRNGTRGMLSALQGYILKHLLFTSVNNL